MSLIFKFISKYDFARNILKRYYLINDYGKIKKGDYMGIDIEKKFFDIKFLDTKSIERNRKILKDVFLIDFDNLEDFFEEKIRSKWESGYKQKAIDKYKISSNRNIEQENNGVVTAIVKYDNKKVQKEYEKFAKKEAKEVFKKIDLKQDIEQILKEMHKITLYIMGEYKISLNDYFMCIRQQETYNNIIEDYIYDNMKNNIYLYKECVKDVNENKDDKKGLLTQQQAIKQYIDNVLKKDEKEKIYSSKPKKKDTENKDVEESLNSDDIIKYKNSNLSDNKNYIRNNSYIWDKVEEMVRDKDTGKIKAYLSNNYMHILWNYSKNRLLGKYKEYSKCEELLEKGEKNIELSKIKKTIKINKKIFKAHTLKGLMEYANSFVENNVKFYDLYWFERLNNIGLIFNLVYIINKTINNISDENKDNLIRILYFVVYLPNVFQSSAIINMFIDVYKEGEYIENQKEFESEMLGFCCDLSFFIIPLYSMIFSNVVYEYCYIKKIELSKFVNKVYKKKEDTNIEKLYKKWEDKEFTTKMLRDIQSLSVLLNGWLDFDLFDRNNMILNEMNMQIKPEEMFNNEERKLKYKKELKKFFLYIACI